jgi:hypothetical protein
MPKMQRAESEKSSGYWESHFDELPQGSYPPLINISLPVLHCCNVINGNLAKPQPKREPSVGKREIYLEISIS